MTNANQAPLPRLSKRRWYVLRLLSGAISSTWLYLYLYSLNASTSRTTEGDLIKQCDSRAVRRELTELTEPKQLTLSAFSCITWQRTRCWWQLRVVQLGSHPCMNVAWMSIAIALHIVNKQMMLKCNTIQICQRRLQTLSKYSTIKNWSWGYCKFTSPDTHLETWATWLRLESAIQQTFSIQHQ